MEAYAAALKYAIPVFIFLITLEYVIGLKKGVITIRSLDTISH